ncbi:flavodoxin family protein [Bengtsoniella intestinalis]|uniref:flavodoxin family protein n=1 Tax=Bengtsoniella intestinalis TaxID=3073143 RepID=UPI00391EF6AE
MNASVVYYTKSGNTKKIADAIGVEVGTQAGTIDNALTQPVDLLFLGASVYKFGIDKAVLTFIDTLTPAMVGKVAIFSTSAMSDSGYPILCKALAAKGIPVVDQHFYCKGKFAFANKNRPNEEDVQNAKTFAKSAMMA